MFVLCDPGSPNGDNFSMKKIMLSFNVLLIAVFSVGQNNKIISAIDSVIAEDHTMISVVSTVQFKTSIEASHGGMNWNICQVIKYREGNIPSEVQKIWIDRDTGCDTFQVDTYFFHYKKLVKFNSRYTDPKKLEYWQNIYFNNDKILSAIDSEGKTPGSGSHLIEAKKILKRIRRQRNSWVLN